MKKYISVLIILCMLCIAATGCAGKEDNTLKPMEGVDVDLAVLNGTMLSAQLNNMMENDNEYFGKTVRLRGIYAASYFEGTSKYYYWVITNGCCNERVEFLWNGDHKYPDDYPADGVEIELIGKFGSYTELDVSYYCIKVDDINIL